MEFSHTNMFWPPIMMIMAIIYVAKLAPSNNYDPYMRSVGVASHVKRPSTLEYKRLLLMYDRLLRANML